MKVSLKRQNQGFHFISKNEEGNSIDIDASENIGGEGKGVRPMQLLLMALGGCSAIDIGLILKKQKLIMNSFEIEIDGEREVNVEPSLFTTINVVFKINGNLDKTKVIRAVNLSMEKYCSVAKTLEKTAVINYVIELNGERI